MPRLACYLNYGPAICHVIDTQLYVHVGVQLQVSDNNFSGKFDSLMPGMCLNNKRSKNKIDFLWLDTSAHKLHMFKGFPVNVSYSFKTYRKCSLLFHPKKELKILFKFQNSLYIWLISNWNLCHTCTIIWRSTCIRADNFISDSLFVLVRFQNYLHSYFLNCTPLGQNTILWS